MKVFILLISLISWTYAQECTKVFQTKTVCLSETTTSINEKVTCPDQNNVAMSIQAHSLEYHVVPQATCPPVTPALSTCYNLTFGANCDKSSCTLTETYKSSLNCLPDSSIMSHYVYFSYTCIPVAEQIDLCQKHEVTTSIAHLLDPSLNGGSRITDPINCMCQLTLSPGSEVVISTPWFTPNATTCDRSLQFHSGSTTQPVCAQYDTLVLSNCGSTGSKTFTAAFRTHTKVETAFSITIQGSYLAPFHIKCGVPDTAPTPTQAQIRTTGNFIITTSTFAPATLSSTAGPSSTLPAGSNGGGDGDSSSGLSTGAIAGIVVGLLVAVGLAIGAVLFYFLKIKKDKENKQPANKINMKFKSKENPYEYDNTVCNSKDELADLDYTRYETVRGKPDVNLNDKSENGHMLNNGKHAADPDKHINVDMDYEPTFIPVPPKVESSDL